MKVAVAGATGFIGRHTVAALHAAGHTVVGLGRTAEVAVDLAAGPVPAGALAGCDAVVNLVGIKAGSDDDFEGAHVRAVGHLLDAASRDDVPRFVHVSVVDLPGSATAYATTKRAGETLVTACDRQWTILRPALVVGDGDDALRNTIALVKAAPVLVVPRPNPGRLAAVRVQDVAAAIVAALLRPVAIGRTYDIVGPQRPTLAELARRTADALGLPVRTIALPAALLRPGAALLERLHIDLITRSQLDLLSRGLDGDAAPAKADLGIDPTPIDEVLIRSLAETVDPPSVRLLPASHRDDATTWSAAAPQLRWFVPLALALMLAAPRWIPDVWTRMALVETALATVALTRLRLPWRRLLSPRVGPIAAGLVLAAGMYLGGAVVFAGLDRFAPSIAARVHEVSAWTNGLSPGLGLVLLAVIVTGEDLVWRAAVTLPLVSRLGPLGAATAAGTLFALAHVTTGPPVLWIAAWLAGVLWSLWIVRTRSLWSVVACHAAWDVAVAYVRPYV